MYCGGTAEGMLGKIDWKKRGLVMDTKLYPNAVRAATRLPDSICLNSNLLSCTCAGQCAAPDTWSSDNLTQVGGAHAEPLS